MIFRRKVKTRLKIKATVSIRYSAATNQELIAFITLWRKLETGEGFYFQVTQYLGHRGDHDFRRQMQFQDVPEKKYIAWIGSNLVQAMHILMEEAKEERREREKMDL